MQLVRLNGRQTPLRQARWISSKNLPHKLHMAPAGTQPWDIPDERWCRGKIRFDRPNQFGYGNTASCYAMSLFVNPSQASLLSVLLNEYGYLDLREMVVFQALCAAPLAHMTVWRHIRATAGPEFLQRITNLPGDVIEDALQSLNRLGVVRVEESHHYQRKRLGGLANRGITIRPLRLYHALMLECPEARSGWDACKETMLLLRKHDKEIRIDNFKNLVAHAD